MATPEDGRAGFSPGADGSPTGALPEVLLGGLDCLASTGGLRNPLLVEEARPLVTSCEEEWTGQYIEGGRGSSPPEGTAGQTTP